MIGFGVPILTAKLFIKTNRSVGSLSGIQEEAPIRPKAHKVSLHDRLVELDSAAPGLARRNVSCGTK